MRGYVRITSSYRTHCPHCRTGLGVLRLCDVLSEAWWDWKHGTALDSERLRRYERKDGGL
ncbi:MAG TPA: hypothetical protein PKC83_11225 [Gemmatimonadaceae bacterium]|nr:hypothetical protein [Gemmatimonadaceae bacterium]